VDDSGVHPPGKLDLSLGVCLHALAKADELGLSNCNAGGLVIGSDAFFASRSAKIAALSLRHAMPSVSESASFPRSED
jgi:hypothetical protein